LSLEIIRTWLNNKKIRNTPELSAALQAMLVSPPEEIKDLLSTEFKIRTLKRNIEFDLYIGEELLPASEKTIHYPLDNAVSYEMGETAARIDEDGVLRYCRIKTHIKSTVSEYEVQISSSVTARQSKLVLFKFEKEPNKSSFNMEQLHKVLLQLKQLPFLQHRWLLGLLQFEYQQYAFSEIMNELRITSETCPILLLPNELLLKIIEYLKLKEVASFASCCKYLSRIFVFYIQQRKNKLIFSGWHHEPRTGPNLRSGFNSNYYPVGPIFDNFAPMACKHCPKHCPGKKKV